MSTLTVTTINTIDATTDLFVLTGNTNAGKMVIKSNGNGIVLQGNSTTNTVSINSTSVNIKGALLANGSMGTVGQVLTSNGAGNVYWSTVTSGGGSGSVTQVGGDGTVSGLTLTGTVTSTGNLTLGGTLSVPLASITTTGTANNSNYLRGDGAWSTAVSSVTAGAGLSGGPITSTGTISINANTGIIANSQGVFVDSSKITANSTNFVGATAAADVVTTTTLAANLSYYTMTSGLNSIITAYNYINNSDSYTISGVHNHNANIALNKSIYLNGDVGTAGQVLTSNGTSNVYWSSVAGFIVANSGILANEDGIFVNANSGIVANGLGVFAKAGTGIVANATGICVNTAYIQTLTSNNTAHFNGEEGAYYTNASNITTGTLPYAQLGANVVNTTADFTITGVHTHNANLSVNGTIFLGGSNGEVGQVLTSNGTGNVYWSTISSSPTYTFANGVLSTSGTVTVVANNGIIANGTGVYVNAGNGLAVNASGTHVIANNGIVSNTTGTFVNANNGIIANGTGVFVNGNTGLTTNTTGVHINANNGIVANTLGVFVNANSGIVANSLGVFVNTAFIGATSANNATYLNTQPASFYTNATNITTGTLPYAQLGANVLTTTGTFNNITGVHTHNANLAVTGYLTVTGVANVVGNAQISSLGVGTAASGGAGEIRATNNITAYYSSDQNFKENVVVITNALEKTNKIRGVEFDWTADYITRNGGVDNYFIRKHDVGVIAQEIEKVLPEVVATRDDGSKAVKYDRIVALLIEAIKELEARVAVLEAKQ